MPKSKSKSPISVAVIGSGYWGKNLVRNFYELGVLKLVCDKNDAMLQSMQKQYNGVGTCLATSDVLARDDIDGIVIASPAETHFNLAREALLADKHVFVEKPLVLDEAEAEELIALAGRRDKVLMVGHLLQYHPVFLQLKQLALSGELGRINYIYSQRLNLGKIRREENILWSFAPHDISMILSLAGEEPETVLTTGGNYLHQKIADVTTTHLEFPSGLRAHIFVSWLHPFKEQKLVVVGDRKMAVFDDTQVWEDKLLLYAHEISWQNNIPVPAKAEPERVDIEQSEPLRQECHHFLDCITNGVEPTTDGHEGLRVLKVLNAGQASLNECGRKIVFGADGEHRWELGSEPLEARGQKATNADVFIHPTAVIDDSVTIGRGSKIWHFSHVLSESKIGERCNIGQNVVIGPDVTIGKGCKIQNNVSVFKGVTLEDGVFCGPSMVFTNIYNPRAEIRKMDQVRPTLVKKGATIGANATIVCGTTLGKYCFIGAGAVVNRNIPDHALVVGNPAKQIGWACSCGERLSDDLECLACGKQFQKKTSGLVPIVVS
jgi:UDP-2-acetamido-3-amino-2,3-dideoxy-glucuronate N-acetyltransferase